MRIHCDTYEIYLEDWDAFREFLNKSDYSKVAVLVDENTSALCLPKLAEYTTPLELHSIEIQSGEENKTISTCESIWAEMIRIGLDRKSLMINLGGGVIGDMGGFCASTYMRGIDFIQVPTTLLAMTDASIGGKLGVDFTGLKNMIGLFKHPKCIMIDPAFLKTLPFGELKSGFAENLKHGLIKDEEFWSELNQIDLESYKDWGATLHQSILIKKQVVQEDPIEKGFRKILNYGHTVGHAIESHYMNSNFPISHGEAIVAGMISENYISLNNGLLSEGICLDIQSRLLNYFGKLDLQVWDERMILELMTSDKKNESGRILFSLITRPGDCQYNVEVNPETIKRALNYYHHL